MFYVVLIYLFYNFTGKYLPTLARNIEATQKTSVLAELFSNCSAIKLVNQMAWVCQPGSLKYCVFYATTCDAYLKKNSTKTSVYNLSN